MGGTNDCGQWVGPVSVVSVWDHSAHDNVRSTDNFRLIKSRVRSIAHAVGQKVREKATSGLSLVGVRGRR